MAVKYITAAEVKSETTISSLAALEEADIEKLIVRAEDRIDAYFGNRPHHEDDTDANRVFPRKGDEDDDGNPKVPEKVKTATLYTVELLHVQGTPSTVSDMSAPMQSESINASGYSYNRGKPGDAKKAARESLLPTEAKMLLDQLTLRTFPLSVD